MKDYTEDNAALLYETYCKAVGGVAFNNEPLPSWKEFSGDPKKRRQADGWREVARQALEIPVIPVEPPANG